MKVKTLQASNMKAPEGYQFMMIVPNYWGKGNTVQECIEKVHEAGGNCKGDFKLLLVDPEATLDGMGGICRPVKGKASIDVMTYRS